MESLAEGCIIAPVALIATGIGWWIDGSRLGGFVGTCIGVIAGMIWIGLAKNKVKKDEEQKRLTQRLTELSRGRTLAAPHTQRLPRVVATPAPKAISSPSSQSQLYLLLDGQVKGPFTSAQIEALIQVGTATLDTQCCIAGTEHWQLLRTFVS